MTKTKILSILIFSLLASCRGQNNSTTTSIGKGRTSSDTRLIPKDSNTLYFPLNSLNYTSANTLYDSFFNKWYSAHLFALKEPIIYSDKSQDEIYRFTWLRTFHNPITIRIEKHKDNYTLYWKLTNGAGGYNPGELITNKQKTLDKKTWEEFIKKLNQSDFWNLVINHNDTGKDGSQWILEGKLTNKYHVVDKWSPNESSKFYECCNFLLGLTELKIDAEKKY